MKAAKNYDKIANQYKIAEESLFRQYIVKPAILSIAPEIINKKVIDLACGSGWSTRILKTCNPNKILGIDVSKKEISLAEKSEKNNPQGISYLCENVLDLKKSYLQKYDVAFAAFLLHYSKNRDELDKMCAVIHKLLNKNGEFITLNNNPNISIFENPKYEATISAKLPVKEGDALLITYYKDEKPLLAFNNYFWIKNTYEKSLKRAGFKEIEWFNLFPSKEGVTARGASFWKEYLKTPPIIGIRCRA